MTRQKRNLFITATVVASFAAVGRTRAGIATPTVTTLVDFPGNGNAYGLKPDDAVTLDSAGGLFGTTQSGRTYGPGTIFELSADHQTLTNLVNFSDGYNATAPMVADAAGNLYGTTNSGGPVGNGEVFELSGSGYVTAVPEPTGMLFLVAAAGSLARRARKSRTALAKIAFAPDTDRVEPGDGPASFSNAARVSNPW